MSYFIYIIHSGKLDRYYTGISSNPDLRLWFHNNPEETRKFTAKAKDWKEVWRLEVGSRQVAQRLESHIKRMKSKKYIQNLIMYPEIASKLMARYDG